MKVTLNIISYFLAKLFKKARMSKKRKRKFLLGFILGRCSRVNADLFVEGLGLPPVFSSKPAICRPIPKCGRSHGIVSRPATSAGSNIPNNDNRHFESSLNTIFEWKQIQKKFDKHARAFGIEGNFNKANGLAFQKELIKHMKSTHAYFSYYRGNKVYHYYNPDNNLKVMVNAKNNKFISG